MEEQRTAAASFFNMCRSRGIVGTPIDLLICAVAARLDVPIFSIDPDFPRYARYLPIRLHKPVAVGIELLVVSLAR